MNPTATVTWDCSRLSAPTGLGGSSFFGVQAEPVGFPRPHHRHKGLQPFAPQNRVTMESGFQAI
ncbi:MAG: hypothetical protein EA001_05875 [Oscillatoriales cyanobacterium]|nr:MAG: hypothetical protein EA001_05875 [Oscillatoriales cyanobacterium]